MRHIHIGRFDLSLTHLIDTHYSTKTKRTLTPHETEILRCKDLVQERINPVLAQILGDNFVTNSFGAVVSHPDTEAQDWHVDSCHLYPQSEQPLPVLPCHFVSVFFPLYQFKDSIGPTEMALGTQVHTNILKNSYVEDQYPTDAVVTQLLAEPNVSRVIIDADPGDVGRYTYSAYTFDNCCCGGSAYGWPYSSPW
jgi:hypothetical protein